MVHDALFARGQLNKGETVLVTGAASGVGVTTLVLAKYLGARVIGTSRSAEKLERLKELTELTCLRLDALGTAGSVTDRGRAAITALRVPRFALYMPAGFDRRFAEHGTRDREPKRKAGAREARRGERADVVLDAGVVVDVEDVDLTVLRDAGRGDPEEGAVLLARQLDPGLEGAVRAGCATLDGQRSG